jgi:hypothetical protein
VKMKERRGRGVRADMVRNLTDAQDRRKRGPSCGPIGDGVTLSQRFDQQDPTPCA